MLNSFLKKTKVYIAVLSHAAESGVIAEIDG